MASFSQFPEEEAKAMNYERKDREAGCSIGDLVAALYDEVIELPLSDPAKESLVAVMLDDIMSREGRPIAPSTGNPSGGGYRSKKPSAWILDRQHSFHGWYH
jgi:hypothetical protein